MFDEDSLPWFHRNILQRLLDDDGTEAERLVFLVNDQGSQSASSAKIDFGDGNISDISELIVFEYPKDGSREEFGKGKNVMDEGGAKLPDGQGTATSTRYLAVGVQELFSNRRKKRKRERKQNARLDQAGRERSHESDRNISNDNNASSFVEITEEQQTRRQRRAWAMLPTLGMRTSEEDAQNAGDDQVEIEMVELRSENRNDSNGFDFERGDTEAVQDTPRSPSETEDGSLESALLASS